MNMRECYIILAKTTKSIDAYILCINTRAHIEITLLAISEYVNLASKTIYNPRISMETRYLVNFHESSKLMYIKHHHSELAFT